MQPHGLTEFSGKDPIAQSGDNPSKGLSCTFHRKAFHPQTLLGAALPLSLSLKALPAATELAAPGRVHGRVQQTGPPLPGCLRSCWAFINLTNSY